MEQQSNIARYFVFWAHPKLMTNKDKFFEYVLPWLILLLGPLVLYLLMTKLIVTLVVISGFFRSILNVIGL